MGNISSLPKSIAMDKTIFENGEYAAKLDAGPTAARPGPILLKQAAVAVKFVSISNISPVSKDKSIKITKNSKKYTVKYTLTPFMVWLSTVFPSNFTLPTERGWSIFLMSLKTVFMAIITLDTFMPPPVEPAQLPINIMVTRRVWERVGQRSKSVVA